MVNETDLFSMLKIVADLKNCREKLWTHKTHSLSHSGKIVKSCPRMWFRQNKLNKVKVLESSWSRKISFSENWNYSPLHFHDASVLIAKPLQILRVKDSFLLCYWQCNFRLSNVYLASINKLQTFCLVDYILAKWNQHINV